MCVIFCRPPSHPSLPKAEGAEGLKWGSGRGKGQGQAGGRARSEAKLGYPGHFFFLRKRSNTDQRRGLLDTHKHVRSFVRACVRVHVNAPQ